MRTRRSKKAKSSTNVRLSFGEVKEEPEVKWMLLQPQATLNLTPETVNKHNSTSQTEKPDKKSRKTCYRRSRATQVSSEDIDAICVKSLDPSNVQAENKPILPIGTEAVIPQCRFCLRRVSRAHLKIILSKHKTKALAAFQIRVFPNDAYPFACCNCLNLLDMILDFKSSVTKARNLLSNKRMHLESNGWDDPTCIEVFNQCKAFVEQHRIQIDAEYDEQMIRKESLFETKMETRQNESIFESKIEMNVEEQESPYTYDDFDDEQSTEATDKMVIEPIVELRSKSETDEVAVSVTNVDEDIDNDRCLITLNADITLEASVENENCTSAKQVSSVDEDYVPLSKRRKAKVIKSYSEFEQDLEDEKYTLEGTSSSDDDDYIPEILEVTSKKSKVSSVQNTNNDICVPEEVNANNKAKAKQKKGRKPKKKESILNRPPDYKPSSLVHVLCDLCGEKMRPETVEGHKNRHLGIKPYTCPTDGCELTFYGRTNMSMHLRRRHPENGVPYQKCEICGKYIRGNQSIFNQHKKRHFLNEKNHVCNVCGKGFTLGRYLRQHSIIHTGLLPYECSYCGKKFNNKWSMRTHEKNIHEKKNQPSAGYDLDPMVDAPTSEVNYFENK